MNLDPANIQEIIRIGALVLALVIAWGILRLIFRLARRVFSLGCGIIVLIGAFLVLSRFVH
ncbi:MAG: hypothetical protein ABFD44_01720 [Anaerolineaceae bacterium]